MTFRTQRLASWKRLCARKVCLALVARVRESTFTPSSLFSVDYIFTMGDFAAFLDTAVPTSDTRPVVAVMDNAIDFKAYLTPHLTSYSGHTGMEQKANTGGPRAFRFKYCGDEKSSKRFVGMQYKEFAGDQLLPWIGLNGSTADISAVPVFQSIPDPLVHAPLCGADTVLPTTLAADIRLLSEWFRSGKRLIAHSDQDLCGDEALMWFQSVLDAKTLGARRVVDTPGVGSAATLYSPLKRRDVSVRSVCCEPLPFAVSLLGADPIVEAEPLIASVAAAVGSAAAAHTAPIPDVQPSAAPERSGPTLVHVHSHRKRVRVACAATAPPRATAADSADGSRMKDEDSGSVPANKGARRGQAASQTP